MTTTILIAIVAFLVITLVLVALLLFAKAKLTSSGDVTIDINNGEKIITAESGGTLLSTLANNKVFLPSACGGGGSCGMCKCQVLEGGGDILPTETGFISRKMAKDHWRLGCQVKVKENLKIKVPEAVLGVKKWECTVVSNRNISTFLKEFVVKLPEGENLKFRSGGYIQIDIPKYDAIKFSDMEIDERFREDWDKMKMWDLVTTNPEPTFRAYSMANHPAEGNIIMLNIRIATPPFDRAAGSFMKVNPGICSSYIFSRKPGDKVTISGPYGEFFLPDDLPDTQELIFIGGGAGMAPMPDREGFPQLQDEPGARPSRSRGGCRRREVYGRFRAQRAVRELPQEPRGTRRVHLSHVRPSDDDRVGRQDARQPRRAARKYSLRQFRVVAGAKESEKLFYEKNRPCCMDMRQGRSL